MVSVSKHGMKIVSDMIKSGYILKAEKTANNLIGLSLLNLENNREAVKVENSTFNQCISKLSKVFSVKELKIFNEINIDDSFSALIKNEDFSLKIGSKYMVIDSQKETKQKVFDSYIFTLTDGVHSFEVDNSNVIKGIEALSAEAAKYSGEESRT